MPKVPKGRQVKDVTSLFTAYSPPVGVPAEKALLVPLVEPEVMPDMPSDGEGRDPFQDALSKPAQIPLMLAWRYLQPHPPSHGPPVPRVLPGWPWS